MVRGQQRGLGTDHSTEKNHFCAWWCAPGGSEGTEAGGALLGNSLLWVWGLRLSELPGFPWEGSFFSSKNFFSCSFATAGVNFPLAGMSQTKWDVLSRSKRDAQGSGKATGMGKVLESLNCAHGGDPRAPAGLWRALGHGEHPRRHPRMCWGDIWGQSKARGGDGHKVWILLRGRNSLKIRRDPG